MSDYNYDYDDDDGYVGYIPTTVDPGYYLLMAAIIFTFSSNALLPCMVTLGRRYEMKHKTPAAAAAATATATATVDEEEPAAAATAATAAEKEEEHAAARLPASPSPAGTSPSEVGQTQNSPVPHSPTSDHVWSVLNQIVTPPYADGDSVVGGSPFRNSLRSIHSRSGGNESTTDGSSRARNKDDTERHPAAVKVAADDFVFDPSILDAGQSRAYGLRRQRRALRDKKRVLEHIHKKKAEHRSYHRILLDSGGSDEDGLMLPLDNRQQQQQQQNNRGKSHDSDLSPVSRKRAAVAVKSTSVLSGAYAMDLSPPSIGDSPSVLSKLQDTAISPHDAPDAHDPGTLKLWNTDENDNQARKPLQSSTAALKRASSSSSNGSVLMAAFDYLVALAEWDGEMKRIVRLCVPYSVAALLESVVDVVIVALVSRYLGVEAIAAFTLVNTILAPSEEFLSGILASEATLCSHAIGTSNYKLAGQYVQVSAFLYSALMIPNIIIWCLFIYDVIRLFGFDESTARMGQDYAYVLLFHQWVDAMSDSYNELLNVIDREQYVTIIGVVEGICAVVATALLVVFRPNTTIQEVGIVHLIFSVLFFLFTCWFTMCNKWINKYLEGLAGSFAITNKSAVKTVVRAAIPLAFGQLLENAEFEILTIFAVNMGPAEVAAWGILGTLWDSVETLTEGMADAGEVRCAYHLGNGKPQQAQRSAYKSILLGVTASFFFTAIIFMMGENLATWFSSDPALQNMIAELIPLLGIANITITAGAVAWALVGSQGRYRLATLIALCSSWGFTIPLAAIFTYGFHFNLQGVTTAIVIGDSITCTALFYVLLRSDWERISNHVVQTNAEWHSDSDSDSDSDSEDSESNDNG